jgi:hypothetical protein
MLVSANGRAVLAEEQQSTTPRKLVESKQARSNASDQAKQNDVVDQSIARAQKALAELLQLENRLLVLSQRQPTDSNKAEIDSVTDAISKAVLRIQAPHLKEMTVEQAAQPQQLQQMKEQLAEREKQTAVLAKQLAEQRRPPLPPLENGTMKVYRLSFVPAREAAATVESLIGSQTLRFAVDERNNSLIAYSKPESVPALDTLLMRLDEQAAEGAKGENSKQSSAAGPRSLLLRVFWLADNLPGWIGQDPNEFLPKSVVEATGKLGLVSPRLVTQTVNSLAIGREDAVDFSTYVPALLFDQPVSLTCEGKLKLASDDRVRSEMVVTVEGPTLNCNLRGSLATPLGHYMVLGTANSVLAEGTPENAPIGAAPGMMGPGMGPRAPAGGRAGVAPEQAGPGGFRGGPVARKGLGGAAGSEGGAAPGGEFGVPGAPPQPENVKFNSSRFAFVVQVVGGQSYPAENDKPGKK